jgi:23S rRNA (pseudouridine1915-N3)-methyltransferase
MKKEARDMKIKIIGEEKIQHKYTKEAIKEYTKRLSKYCKIEHKVTRNIEKETNKKTYIIKIDKDGAKISSEKLANKINDLGIQGYSNITIILNNEFNENIDFYLNISNMDMDTDLLLIIIYEQIYRAYRIINNAPYHK